ncbi:Heparan sulfate 2-O-sulfotransferase 1 [Elysia marginata]|uniref:Heparan sulfate 2-O-sulfotransferase 1 n=1 Tax=Elysia marginata TaxID=1093978 RepID=A0AAV4IGS5_9GAST|nr:Heparan sulfate 2-O-sulfotransferase 1 [Elysia marginata]
MNLPTHPFIIDAIRRYSLHKKMNLPTNPSITDATRCYSLHKPGTGTHLRQTSHKVAPSEATLMKMESSPAYRMEREFYQFVLKNFMYTKNNTISTTKKGKFYTKRKIYDFDAVSPTEAAS